MLPYTPIIVVDIRVVRAPPSEARDAGSMPVWRCNLSVLLLTLRKLLVEMEAATLFTKKMSSRKMRSLTLYRRLKGRGAIFTVFFETRLSVAWRGILSLLAVFTVWSSTFSTVPIHVPRICLVG